MIFTISKDKDVLYKNRFIDRFKLRIRSPHHIKFNMYFLDKMNKRFSWSGTRLDKTFGVYFGELYVFEYLTDINKTFEVSISEEYIKQYNDMWCVWGIVSFSFIALLSTIFVIGLLTVCFMHFCFKIERSCRNRRNNNNNLIPAGGIDPQFVELN